MNQGAVLVASVALLNGSIAFAGNMGVDTPILPSHGLFLGLGGSYNSINLNQTSWGKGISNIQTSTGVSSNGVGQGNGVPFHNTQNTFAPEVQAGYFKAIPNTAYRYGLKFSYQYLGSIATNANLYIPQLGQTTNNSGVTSPLFGYVDGKSIQVTTNHEMTLLAFLGQDFGNKYVYFGMGPSLFNTKSRNYYSVGYADFDGATIDVTGLVSYASPSIWAWGGAAQLGMMYFINETWTVDLSYTYSISGSYTTNHQQGFTNASNLAGVNYTTSGTLFTKDTLSVSSQAVTLSINKVFDV